MLHQHTQRRTLCLSSPISTTFSASTITLVTCGTSGPRLDMFGASFGMLCREAQLEKKAARREATKEREQSPDMSKLPGGGDIMGGDDSFAAAKARSGPIPNASARKRQSAASESRV